MAGKAMSNGCLLTKIRIFFIGRKFLRKGWKLTHPNAVGSTVKISLVLEIVGIFTNISDENNTFPGEK